MKGHYSFNRREYVGTFPLAFVNVELYASADTFGGSIHYRPTSTSPPRMIVGLRSKEWAKVVDVLLHESFEFSADMFQCQYRHTTANDCDTADLTFVFDHQEFTRICTSAGYFMADVMPKLREHFDKHMKSQRKKKRKAKR